ncbi:paramyosin-like isoform X1 [Clarias magur]|uniref:Paramyosin-like isoform X1 n=1 Tax=Clarias magur TaxID=1594786 RepID=A0A8J4U1I8_CLAMG|nr:paramyosin-like isoform X1 [Clarias magur]
MRLRLAGRPDAETETEKPVASDPQLRENVRKLQDLFCEVCRDFDKKSKECAQDRVAQSTLQSEYNAMKGKLKHCAELLMECCRELETHSIKLAQSDEMDRLKHKFKELLMEYGREREAHNQLQLEYKKVKETLKHSVEQLNDSLVEAEVKHHMAAESTAQVEAGKPELADQVGTLQGTVRDLRKPLCQTKTECDELKDEYESDRDIYNQLPLEYEEMKETLTHNEEIQKVSLAEEEAELQKSAETTLRMEVSDQVGTLQDTLQDIVEDLRKRLCQAHTECDGLKNASAQERETHSIVQAKNDDLKEKLKLSEALLIEYERDREASNRLHSEYEEMKETLMHNEEQLKVSLSEAEEELQNAAATTAQIEAEKSELADQVRTLQDTVEDLRKLLCQARTECDQLKIESAQERETRSIVQAENDDLKEKFKLSEALLIEYERDREASNILQVEYEEMKKTLMHNEELLKVSLAQAEAELQKATESTARTKAEKSELSVQVGTLQDTVRDLRTLQYQAQIECNELKNASAQEREAHSIVQAENDELKKKLKLSEALLMEYERDREACNLLKVEYEEMKRTLTHNQELLNVSLLKADEKFQKSAETTPRTEAEKSELSDQVATLQDTVQDLKKQLSQAHTEYDELKHASAQEREAHSIVQAENDDLKAKLKLSEALLIEYERDQEACNLLQVEYGKMKKTLMYNEEQLKASAQEREAHIIIQAENDELKEKLKLSEALLMEYKREREACDLLPCENKEVMKTHNEELLKVSLVEAEEEQQNPETTAQMEAEISEGTPQDAVQDLRKLLCQTQNECDKLKNETAQAQEAHSIVQTENNELKERLKLSEALLMKYERDREACNLLQVEYEEMKATLTHSEESLKVSLAEAEEELHKATETTARTEAEKSELADQVKTLQDTVQDLRKQLFQANASAQEREAHIIVQAENDELKEKLKLSEALLMEYERDREASNILQVEYEEMKKTLMHNEEQLKVSLAEAEAELQKATESTARTKAEKSELSDQVGTLQDTVRDLRTLQYQAQIECDELKNESTQEREARSIVQAENDDLTAKLKLSEALLMEYERDREASKLLQVEYEKVKATLTHREEQLKVSLAEAALKHRKAMETIAQLEAQKSDQGDEMNALQETVQNMGNLLCESQRDCDKLTDECTQQQHAHRILRTENDDLKETVKHFLIEYEREQEAHNLLQFEHEEMKVAMTYSEEVLKGSLAVAEEKYQKAMETIAQLEAQKADLRDEMNTLQEALQNMGTLLREADRDEPRDESQVSRTESERNHQSIDETIARLAAEKSDLADKIKRLQDTVQKLGNLLCEAHRDFDELANKYEQVQEAHNILQPKYNEMKESLKHKEELLKKHGVTFGSTKTTDVQTGGSVDMNGFSPESVLNMQYKERKSEGQ